MAKILVELEVADRAAEIIRKDRRSRENFEIILSALISRGVLGTHEDGQSEIHLASIGLFGVRAATNPRVVTGE